MSIGIFGQDMVVGYTELPECFGVRLRGLGHQRRKLALC